MRASVHRKVRLVAAAAVQVALWACTGAESGSSSAASPDAMEFTTDGTLSPSVDGGAAPADGSLPEDAVLPWDALDTADVVSTGDGAVSRGDAADTAVPVDGISDAEDSAAHDVGVAGDDDGLGSASDAGDSVDGSAPQSDADAAETSKGCLVDTECPNGRFCLAGTCVATKPCTKDAQCTGDPLGPKCKNGTCGCNFAYAGWWGWGDSEWADPCPAGRYCPPEGESCRSKCQSDADCTLVPHNKCYENGRCGCSSDPAQNQCDLFCAVLDYGAVPGYYGLCEPCEAVYSYPFPGNFYWNPVVQHCKNGGDPKVWCKWTNGGLCVGAACMSWSCTEDSDCDGLSVWSVGMAQADLPLRCYRPLNRCAPSCKTLDDCPAIYRHCMKNPSCKKVDADDEWGFCGSWDEP